ncbi:MAG: DUF359 domain-containing protein [Crenarchaeota archaeon]|nr:MAG: DUF359 domain-containing protein [Thermoproteota archaeon]RDJ32926.1 MAG: DUF359 domain-containing protein [Thermoproteota archaeon]RDJ35992.1 MAG: DUF359 domain-containing protein [Thermoproteota archaeon]RDJ38239.1 MAG: DUF359 domain-containing protein [Thermoproteota archaeon]
MKLPENLREKLKIPLGALIPNAKTNKEEILKLLPKDAFVITVGDATTEKMIKYGIIPSLQIVDGQEKRVRRSPPTETSVTTHLTCNNPAAEISSESLETIKKAFSSKPPVRITVHGEEDLLVLPVCINAPENSVVMYGQPNEGLVFVIITAEIKHKVKSLLDLMN